MAGVAESAARAATQRHAEAARQLAALERAGGGWGATTAAREPWRPAAKPAFPGGLRPPLRKGAGGAGAGASAPGAEEAGGVSFLARFQVDRLSGGAEGLDRGGGGEDEVESTAQGFVTPTGPDPGRGDSPMAPEVSVPVGGGDEAALAAGALSPETGRPKDVQGAALERARAESPPKAEAEAEVGRPEEQELPLSFQPRTAATPQGAADLGKSPSSDAMPPPPAPAPPTDEPEAAAADLPAPPAQHAVPVLAPHEDLSGPETPNGPSPGGLSGAGLSSGSPAPRPGGVPLSAAVPPHSGTGSPQGALALLAPEELQPKAKAMKKEAILLNSTLLELCEDARLVLKERSARVGVGMARAHARAWTTGGPEWNGGILALQRDSFALVREAEATLAGAAVQEEAAGA